MVQGLAGFKPGMKPIGFGAHLSTGISGANSGIKKPDDNPFSRNSVFMANTFGNTQRDSEIPSETYLLISLGIPIEVIQQGDNSIRNFAEENNIQLPEKAGRKLNFES